MTLNGTAVYRLTVLTVLLLASLGSPASAQEPEVGRLRFGCEAIQRALADVTFQRAPLDPRSNWAQVQRLSSSTEVFISRCARRRERDSRVAGTPGLDKGRREILIGVASFGIPTAGGLAGYYLPGGRTLATIYLKS